VCGYFPERLKLTELTPVKVAGFIGWLCEQTRPAPTKEDKDRRVRLSDATVRNIMAALRSCLATAVREGAIRSNPARDLDLPHRPTAEGSEADEVKALKRDELSVLLAVLPERWQLFFRFLAATGLRISEAIALQWRHLELDGSSPHVKVRRALVKGRMGAPKSKQGRRDVPLEHSLVLALREHRKVSEWGGEDHPVFAAGNGSPLNLGNVFGRVLKPAAEEAGVPWAGFHTFRHTCASMLFAHGRNAKQVQRWLGHHSAAFTLSVYIDLLDDGIGEGLVIGEGAHKVQPSPTPSGTVLAAPLGSDSALAVGVSDLTTPDTATRADYDSAALTS